MMEAGDPTVDTESDDLKFLREAGIAAVRAAQEDLLQRNIGYVYSRDGVIVRHYKDGSEKISSPASKRT